jgi:hypothetical protein
MTETTLGKRTDPLNPSKNDPLENQIILKSSGISFDFWFWRKVLKDICVAQLMPNSNCELNGEFIT